MTPEQIEARRVAHAKRQARYRADNSEKVKAAKRAYYEENRKSEIARAAAWHDQKQSEKRAAQARALGLLRGLRPELFRRECPRCLQVFPAGAPKGSFAAPDSERIYCTAVCADRARRDRWYGRHKDRERSKGRAKYRGTPFHSNRPAQLARKRVHRLALSDEYVACKIGLPKDSIPPVLIAAKRTQLHLHRTIKDSE